MTDNAEGSCDECVIKTVRKNGRGKVVPLDYILFITIPDVVTREIQMTPSMWIHLTQLRVDIVLVR